MTFIEKLPEIEDKQSFLIKKFDDDTRLAKVLTPLVAMGEIIPWFPAVYFAEVQDALIRGWRIVIVTPTRYEPLVERFPCSWRILIKDRYHLSMIQHRHARLQDNWHRYPKPENWSECAQTLIRELKPLLIHIAAGHSVSVLYTDQHTYSPALPHACGHWAIDDYQTKINPHNPKNHFMFDPSEEVRTSFDYNWSQHKRPFLGIHTHAGMMDGQKAWPYWNDFLKIMEERFDGTIFRLGGMDDLLVGLLGTENFIDLGRTYNSVAPLVSQMCQMDYFFGAIGGMVYLSLSQRVPTLAFFDEHTREAYSDPSIDYDGAELMYGWGTTKLDYFLGDEFRDFGPEESFKKFCELREKYKQ